MIFLILEICDDQTHDLPPWVWKIMVKLMFCHFFYLFVVFFSTLFSTFTTTVPPMKVKNLRSRLFIGVNKCVVFSVFSNIVLTVCEISV